MICTNWNIQMHEKEVSSRICHTKQMFMKNITLVGTDRLVGLVVKASTSRAEDPEFKSRQRWVIFRDRVIPVTSKLALQWLPCQVPGVTGSVLGLVGPVSVYWDWVRWKVGSATSISVWQHINLSKQIHPWDTLECCWDVKQPTNKLVGIVTKLHPHSPSLTCQNPDNSTSHGHL